MKTATSKNTKSLYMPLEIKAAQVDIEARTFEGILSTWGLDRHDDIIVMGAYAKTIGYWKASQGKRIIYLIDGHQYRSVKHVIGKLIDAEERAEGLWTKWEVVPGQDGDDVLAKIKGGFLNQMSIGYETVSANYEEITDAAGIKRVIRKITELKLKEGSIVLFAANEETSIDADSVKSFIDAFEADRDNEGLRSVATHLHDRLGALLHASKSVDDTQTGDNGPAQAEQQQINERKAKLRALTLRSLNALT